MSIKISSIKVPSKIKHRIDDKKPQKWVGRLWDWQKGSREKNVLKLLDAIVKKETLSNDPKAREIAIEAHDKLIGRKNRLPKEIKQKLKALETKYQKFIQEPPKKSSKTPDVAPPAEEEEICPITLENLRDVKDKMIAPCGHKFEKQAILSWLKVNPSCPVDRSPLDSINLIDLKSRKK